MKSPLNIGERVVVSGIRFVVARVKYVEYIAKEVRSKITIDWGIHGTSYVWDHDEGKTWFRHDQSS